MGPTFHRQTKTFLQQSGVKSLSRILMGLWWVCFSERMPLFSRSELKPSLCSAGGERCWKTFFVVKGRHWVAFRIWRSKPALLHRWNHTLVTLISTYDQERSQIQQVRTLIGKKVSCWGVAGRRPAEAEDPRLCCNTDYGEIFQHFYSEIIILGKFLTWFRERCSFDTSKNRREMSFNWF